MVTLISFLLNLVASLFKSKGRLDAENAALRHQLVVLQRKVRGRVHFTDSDRLFFIQPLSLVSVCPQCYFYHPARDPCALSSCPLCAGIVPADAVPRFVASRRKCLRADAVRRPKAAHYHSGTRKIAARGGTIRLTSGIMPSSNVRTAP